ncbi:MAG: efflux RND transporter permease subunit [Ignavibacteria bacterium]|nr:efflux RND transporter permease subunit [Ignavibacteria bacterium]MBP7092618.1 efflux RND transporter permease subunit [Candidatus Kapabacteria bacterium]MBK6417871.1 efflux RND transporter permease subunit [Ignavibacteria bacterium]MBK6760899.1 efflux RND transporter permease subunit [Ignavibacteria bacterium]MBK7185491.1 efflux RND transporter permease subunit [Ignavibacteria bacterium]
MQHHKKFPITSWAVENRTTIYVLTVILSILGVFSYMSLPKEQFPDIVVPTILVTTINAGTSPVDVENLISRPLEKQIKSIADVKKVTSTSIQDASIVVVEFTTGIDPVIGKQRVNDAVDRARSDLPTQLTKEPQVQEVDFSEFPIMNVNISGNVGLDVLKQYADDLQDKFESLKEIRRADIIGSLEKEVRVDIDPYRLQAAGISFDDVSRAIQYENVNISGGEVLNDGIRRNLQVTGEFKDVSQIENVIVKGSRGNTVYVRDIATVVETNKEQQSFARLDGKDVVTLAVLKKAGENLINASDQIQQIVKEYSATKLPKNVTITITNDQSTATRINLADLINTIIIGFILVTIVLMFFMGVQNALFVGLATPLSSFIAFLIMPGFDFTFNVVVTFGFLLALGIVVDDAIVVIENTHRLHTKDKIDIKTATKYAAAEVFAPVVAGTLTTLAPFFPLLFWPGLVGEFMVYLPAILIITLTASLVVAYIMNPVFAVDFMDRKPARVSKRKLFAIGAAIGLASVGAVTGGQVWIAFLSIFTFGFWLTNRKFITPRLIKPFQEKTLPWVMDLYRGTLRFVLQGKRPYLVIASMVGLFVVTIFLMVVAGPKVVFFPEADPNYAYVYVQMPIGTDAAETDSVVRVVEQRVNKVLGPKNPLVKSVISNVGLGAGDPQNPDRTITPHKGKVTVAFVEFQYRHGASTQEYLGKFRDELRDLPGVEILVAKESNGPPTGKPINIEISGDELDQLIAIQDRVRRILVDSLQIPGIEKLKSDLVRNKPELSVVIDREKANAEGISTAQVGMALRNSLYGSEATKYRSGEDEYAVQLRAREDMRGNADALLNLPITYRDMSSGQFRQIPMSSIAHLEYSSTFAGINRKNQKRVVTLGSNVLEGFNENEVNAEIRAALKNFELEDGYEIKLTGAQEEQAESANFLAMAFGIAAMLILLIMVTQFNSLSKPLLIMVTVLFSLIGVLLGFVIFRMTFSIVITGVGVIALAGIVVRNGIVLVDFTDVLRKQGWRTKRAIIEGGAIRFNPVVLTAGATILGLVPLAVGLNIDFWELINLRDPHIHIGSDSVAFWGPLAWSIVFGLSFSTFLTLVVVPCMYYIMATFQVRGARRKQRRAMINARLDALEGITGH